MRDTTIILQGFSWPVVAVLLAAAVLMGLLTYRSLRRGGSRRWSAALLGLRLVAFLGLAAALLQPRVVTRRGDVHRNRVAVLLDDSHSMAMPSGTDGSRHEMVAQSLGVDGGFFDRLRANYRCEFLRFGSAVKELTGADVIAGRTPTMDRTDIAEALRGVAQRQTEGTPGGVVLISDGRDTELPESPEDRRRILRRELERLGVPVYTLCPVAPDRLVDVGIARLQCSRLAFLRNRWRAQVELKTTGIDRGRLTVSLRRAENIVDVQQIRVQPGQDTYRVELDFTPAKTGRKLLTVEVEPHPRESYHANNRSAVILSVVRDRVRVLQVAGRPSWDVRFLRRTLKQMPTVDLVSFFILRDPGDDPGGRTANSYVNLIPFPVEELFTRELRTFDVIVFQNFDYGVLQPYPRDVRFYLGNVRRHVIREGGGFVMIGGQQSFDLGNYGGTPLEDILPVRLRGTPGAVDEGLFQARLTEAGGRHPVTSVGGTADDTERLWSRMPELNGCHVLTTNERAGAVLLDHPRLDGVPIVVTGEAGEGRSLAILTDEAWRWDFVAAGRGAGNQVYVRFWRNALRWLVGDDEGERLNLSMAARRVRPGESVNGTVRLLGNDYAPQSGARIRLLGVLSADEQAQSVERFLTTDESGRARFELDLMPPGTWRVEARAMDAEEDSAEKVPTDATFVAVEASGRERQNLLPDTELLRWIARSSGGKFYNIARGDIPEGLPVDRTQTTMVRSRDVRPLWDNWILYGVVAGCLCLEWWLRRKRGVT